MIKHLYDDFAKRWYRGGSVYLYSDPHFGDFDSYFHFRFPDKFATENADEVIHILDQMQINNINKKVNKNDTLIILGDVGNVECVKKLKAGYKVLIMGNHDAGASNYKDGFFDEVYEGPVQIGPKLLLSHEPIACNYALNIHGHCHTTIDMPNDIYHLNMCAEFIDYKPQHLGKIIDHGYLKDIDDIHRITIDNATERKKKIN